MIDEVALDKAAREGYAVRCKTHGPRFLDQYASPDIMRMQLDDARVIVSAYLSALPSQACILLSEAVRMAEAEGFLSVEDLASIAAPMTTWLPIASAPKDGRQFLAAHEKSGVIAITWHGKTSHIPLYGWCRGEDAEDIDLWTPTHWMPVPEPPK